jgi:hypothetical protein
MDKSMSEGFPAAGPLILDIQIAQRLCGQRKLCDVKPKVTSPGNQQHASSRDLHDAVVVSSECDRRLVLSMVLQRQLSDRTPSIQT